MPSSPLVSIVTPTFNSVPYLEQCLQSVIDQDYSPVEHVIQDGGSNDGSVDVLRRYSEKIIWDSRPDKGQAHGLDRALKRTRGDYILVLNADDALLPHACSWAVEQMHNHPEAAVVYGDLHVINSAGEVIGAHYGADPYDFAALLCVEQVPPAQAAFIRRNHFEQVGLRADTSLATCPDYEMWVRIGLRFPMVHVSGMLAKYRWHDNSEGSQSCLIKDFVRAKRKVMDRVFNDPDTKPDICSLRKRAYASLDLWAASMAVNCNDMRRWALYASSGFFRMPNRKNVQTATIQLRHLLAKRRSQQLKESH